MKEEPVTVNEKPKRNFHFVSVGKSKPKKTFTLYLVALRYAPLIHNITKVLTANIGTKAISQP